MPAGDEVAHYGFGYARPLRLLDGPDGALCVRQPALERLPARTTAGGLSPSPTNLERRQPPGLAVPFSSDHIRASWRNVRTATIRGDTPARAPVNGPARSVDVPPRRVSVGHWRAPWPSTPPAAGALRWVVASVPSVRPLTTNPGCDPLATNCYPTGQISCDLSRPSMWRRSTAFLGLEGRQRFGRIGGTGPYGASTFRNRPSPPIARTRRRWDSRSSCASRIEQ
jgi:hypothetical protein